MSAPPAPEYTGDSAPLVAARPTLGPGLKVEPRQHTLCVYRGAQPVSVKSELLATNEDRRRATCAKSAAKPTAAKKPKLFEAGAGPQGEGLYEKLLSDKTFQNKFNYRLMVAPEAVRQEWASLKKASAAEKDRFVDVMVKVQKGDYTGFTSQVTIEHANTKGEMASEGWKTWKQMLEKYDEDVLKLMVVNNTKPSKIDPDVPAEVQWPRNLIVLDTKVEKITHRLRTDRLEIKGESQELSPEEAQAAASCEPGSASSSGLTPSTAAPPMQQHSKDEGVDAKSMRQRMGAEQKRIEKEKLDSALASIRKVHGEYDRKNREWNALLEMTDQHPATKSNWFSEKLKEGMAQANSLDQKLLSLEMKFIAQQSASDDNIDGGKQCAEGLVKILKNCQSRSASLRSQHKAATEEEDAAPLADAT